MVGSCPKVILTMTNVACAIIFRDGKILVTKRGPGMSLSGFWEFPGGKVEKGETAEECIHRELLEELNINVEITGRLTESIYKYEHIHICLIPFLADYKFGNLRLNDHAEFVWASPGELTDFNWAPADVPVVKALLLT
jgi:8-oxo-dGTP diphosphatase